MNIENPNFNVDDKQLKQLKLMAEHSGLPSGFRLMLGGMPELRFGYRYQSGNGIIRIEYHGVWDCPQSTNPGFPLHQAVLSLGTNDVWGFNDDDMDELTLEEAYEFGLQKVRHIVENPAFVNPSLLNGWGVIALRAGAA